MGQAERAVEKYLRLRGRLSAPRAQNIAGAKGVVYAEQCRACGHARRHEVHNERAKAWLMRCAKCGAWWPRETVCIPRNAIDGGERVHEPGSLSDLATLGAALNVLSEQEREILAAFVVWPGPGRADLGLVEVAEQRWPGARPWTQYRIRKLIASARAGLEAELQRRGIA